jgi:hypothetical protein
MRHVQPDPPSGASRPYQSLVPEHRGLLRARGAATSLDGGCVIPERGAAHDRTDAIAGERRGYRRKAGPAAQQGRGCPGGGHCPGLHGRLPGRVHDQRRGTGHRGRPGSRCERPPVGAHRLPDHGRCLVVAGRSIGRPLRAPAHPGHRPACHAGRLDRLCLSPVGRPSHRRAAGPGRGWSAGRTEQPGNAQRDADPVRPGPWHRHLGRSRDPRHHVRSVRRGLARGPRVLALRLPAESTADCGGPGGAHPGARDDLDAATALAGSARRRSSRHQPGRCHLRVD